tara:strand:+ start:727 stop:1212 length:486 start_codon:yes stop_codon:yes gene_type:complete
MSIPVSVSMQIQNGKIRLFFHYNSQNNKIRRTNYPYSWAGSPSPKQLPFPPSHWLNKKHKDYQSYHAEPTPSDLLQYKPAIIDSSLDLLDKFTKISLDSYWQEIVQECCNNSFNSNTSTSPHLERPNPIIVPLVDGIIYDGSEEYYLEPYSRSPTVVTSTI